MKVGWIEYNVRRVRKWKWVELNMQGKWRSKPDWFRSIPAKLLRPLIFKLRKVKTKQISNFHVSNFFQIKLIDIWDESLYSLFSSWIFLFFLRQSCKARTRLDFEGEPWGKTITLDWAFPPLHIVHSAQSTAQSTSQSTSHSTAHPILCNAQSTHNQIHNPLHSSLHNCTSYCEALYFCTAPHWPS